MLILGRQLRQYQTVQVFDDCSKVQENGVIVVQNKLWAVKAPTLLEQLDVQPGQALIMIILVLNCATFGFAKIILYLKALEPPQYRIRAAQLEQRAFAKTLGQRCFSIFYAVAATIINAQETVKNILPKILALGWQLRQIGLKDFYLFPDQAQLRFIPRSLERQRQVVNP